MAHPSEHAAADRPLGLEEAEQLAEAMRMFGTASRLRLLWALLPGERTVEQLAADTELTQTSVSHQLRALRQARLVRVRRDGRHAFYRLHDHHVPDLLAAIRHHREHAHPPPPTTLPADTPARAGTAP